MRIGKWLFEERGLIRLSDAGEDLVWECAPGMDIEGSCVYVWQLETPANKVIVYIGKAGYGLTNRMKQHLNGFRNAQSNSKKKKLIIEDLISGGHYKVYARKTEIITHEIGIDVNPYSWDEHAVYAWIATNDCSASRLRLNLTNFVDVTPLHQTIEEEDQQSDVDFVFSGVENEVLFSKLKELCGPEIAARNEWREVLRYSGMDTISSPSEMLNSTWSVFAKFGKVSALPNTWIFRVPTISNSENWILVPEILVRKEIKSTLRQPRNACGYYVSIENLSNSNFIDWDVTKSRSSNE